MGRRLGAVDALQLSKQLRLPRFSRSQRGLDGCDARGLVLATHQLRQATHGLQLVALGLQLRFQLLHTAAVLTEPAFDPAPFPLDFLAVRREATQLVERHHVVNPFGVQQQRLEMIELLLHALDSAAMLLDTIFEPVFLVAERREFLLELRTVAEQVDELVCVLCRFLDRFEDACQARHVIPFLHNQGLVNTAHLRSLDVIMARRQAKIPDGIDRIRRRAAGPQCSRTRWPWSLRYSSHLLSTMLRRQRRSSSSRCSRTSRRSAGWR